MLGLGVLVLLVVVAALMSQPGDYQAGGPDWLAASERIQRLEQQTIAAMFAVADQDLTGRLGADPYR